MESKLKYPVLLVHGMGFRDNNFINYWGRIPNTLTDMGCTIFYGEQDSNAPIEINAEHLAKRIDDILNETNAEKVNIIAHSKGGLDSRYAISVLGLGDKVASLTTISTPHNGSKTMDKLMKLPKPLMKFIGFCVDFWYRIFGDKKPHTYTVLESFTTKAAKEFNAKVPNHDGVYYQSYAFVMKRPSSDILMWYQNLIVSSIEGENDGLLTPDAVKWGEFKGVYTGAKNRGISHCDEIDLRRKPLTKKMGDGINDIVDIYKTIVTDLIDLGF